MYTLHSNCTRSLSRETKRVDRVIFHRLTDFRPSRTRRVAYANARPVCKCACVYVCLIYRKNTIFSQIGPCLPILAPLPHPSNNHDAANSVCFVRKEWREERKGFIVAFCHANRSGLLIFTFRKRRNFYVFKLLKNINDRVINHRMIKFRCCLSVKIRVCAFILFSKEWNSYGRIRLRIRVEKIPNLP